MGHESLPFTMDDLKTCSCFSNRESALSQLVGQLVDRSV
jgi:hypothetical protein